MKYTISRQFSLKKQKFEVVCDSKVICIVKAALSKTQKGQFNVELTNPISKRLRDTSCTVEPDPNNPQNYLIYTKTKESNATLFGQFTYELCSYDNYLYTIIIGKKLYKVRSCDLKDRRLSIVDTIEQENNPNSDQYSAIQCPETLFQVIDSFSKNNKTYHVTINDKENPFGYLAITILLDLHEGKRD